MRVCEWFCISSRKLTSCCAGVVDFYRRAIGLSPPQIVDQVRAVNPCEYLGNALPAF